MIFNSQLVIRIFVAIALALVGLFLRPLVRWSLNNPFAVLLIALLMALVGGYAFWKVDVEAYPDPAPAIHEIVALYPGATAEEVERQVTVPLEVTFAGMPHLTFLRSKSLYGLSDLHLQFEYGYSFEEARQEIINRMASNLQPLPNGVTPQLSPETPTGEIYRYTLNCPKDPETGKDIYTLNDLKAMQDWVLEREFRRVPGIIDVASFGGTVKRYEIHPDPDRLKLYGMTLAQVQNALSNANQNMGGDIVNQSALYMGLRSVGLIGAGLDPVNKVLGMKDPDAASAQALKEAQKDAKDERDKKRKLEKEAVAHKLWEEQRVRLAKAAAAVLREEEDDRIRQIRQLAVTTITGPKGNNRPILIDDIVEGGPVRSGYPPNQEGVVVSNQTRLGRIGLRTAQTVVSPKGIARVVDPKKIDPRTGEPSVVWRDEDDVVECIVLLRKNDPSLPVIDRVEQKVAELNDPDSGRLLPGVFVDRYYDRKDLINLTTETVRENLLIGMVLVIVILLMFLSNVRSALIVAINIPLALLFAYIVMFVRGRTANLLSVGAVDFGIIVDSSVIVVENIYRHIATHENAHLPLKERILKACSEVQMPLLFSTLIIVCAFVPLFTMSGAEGQLFEPMADTYAFAMNGGLLLAVFVAPVLCLLLFKNLKPAGDNFLVRYLKRSYLRNLNLVLRYRWASLAFFTALIGVTAIFAVPRLGREFMPELEEGNLWIRGTFPLNINLERVSRDTTVARQIMTDFPEVSIDVVQMGRPDDGTDSTGFFNTEHFVDLRPQSEWPKIKENHGLARILWGATRCRTKDELITEMNERLNREIPGVIWNFSQNIRDNVMESMSGIKGDNSCKIFGPDLDKLDRIAVDVKKRLDRVQGMENVGIYTIMGNTNLDFHVDPVKCNQFGVSAADIANVVQTAIGGRAMSSMVEGEKTFDITARWANWRRHNIDSILDIPVDLINNQVVMSTGPGPTPSATGTGLAPPSKIGTIADTTNPITSTPRLKLRDLVSPMDKAPKIAPEMYAPTAAGLFGLFSPAETYGPLAANAGCMQALVHSPELDPEQFQRAGASTIYREGGYRMVAIKFSVRDRDLAGAVAEARESIKDLIPPAYRVVWSGEFEEMEAAESRLMLIIPACLALIFLLLYLAFRSLIDAILVMANVLDLAVGGVWALYFTGTNFSVAAAVGFISIFGVAIMDGLLLVSYFNAMRARGLSLHDAIIEGASKRVRPVMMTALTAVFGLLPAALSTRIGSQTQRPLAIVVVGGMLTTLFLTRYLMPLLYSFYGHREPPAGSSTLAH